MPRRVALVSLVIAGLILAGCTTVAPTPAVTPTTAPAADDSEPVVGPNGESTLSVRLASCTPMTWCRAFVSIQRAGSFPSDEIKVFDWPADERGALPANLEKGTYTVHFRFVMLTDAIADGNIWQTIAECQDQVLATGDYLGAEFELAVSYAEGSCSIVQYVKEAMA